MKKFCCIILSTVLCVTSVILLAACSKKYNISDDFNRESKSIMSRIENDVYSSTTQSVVFEFYKRNSDGYTEDEKTLKELIFQYYGESLLNTYYESENRLKPEVKKEWDETKDKIDDMID